MHELGIAQNILEIVHQAVPSEQQAAVRSIRIRLGPFSGVVPDSLEFSFEAIVHGTEMRHARLNIEQLPAVLKCKDCGDVLETKELEFLCRSCQSSHLELISGRELEISEIELTEESDHAP